MGRSSMAGFAVAVLAACSLAAATTAPGGTRVGVTARSDGGESTVGLRAGGSRYRAQPRFYLARSSRTGGEQMIAYGLIAAGVLLAGVAAVLATLQRRATPSHLAAVGSES